jgi:divalent metal cation (Fe/Co/Zn/Cd) transporter
MAGGGSAGATIAALLANTGIAVAEFVGFVSTGTSSMLAESVHSVADTGDQILLLGLLLGVIAVVLATEMKRLLIVEAASEADEAAIQREIERAPSVRALIHMRTEDIGPESILLAAKVELDSDLTMRELADAIDAVELRVRGAVPMVERIFLEQDVRRGHGDEPVDDREGSAAPGPAPDAG